MRPLRSYEGVAQREHFCDRCCESIQPGDYYEATVYATKIPKFARGSRIIPERKTIVTIRYHKNPGCEFPEDPDKEFSDLENNIEELKVAA